MILGLGGKVAAPGHEQVEMLFGQIANRRCRKGFFKPAKPELRIEEIAFAHFRPLAVHRFRLGLAPVNKLFHGCGQVHALDRRHGVQITRHGCGQRDIQPANRIQIIRHGSIEADALPFGFEVAIQPFKGGKGVAGLAGRERGGL